MELTERQIERYTHHLILKDIGGEGQKRLLSSSVLVVGLGGLGSPAALYLAAAGIGTIGLIDDDRVEESNLQRQIIHETADLGLDKTASAAEKIRAINRDSRPQVYSERLTEGNVETIISKYDFVIDGTDNFPAKFLINDTCVKLGKPFSHGGVAGFRGQTFTYSPGTMCLRCVFGEPPGAGFVQNCRGSGILGAVAGIIGSIQAAEAIKSILKKGSLISNRLLTIDALDMQMRFVNLARNINCPICRSLELISKPPRQRNAGFSSETRKMSGSTLLTAMSQSNGEKPRGVAIATLSGFCCCARRRRVRLWRKI